MISAAIDYVVDEYEETKRNAKSVYDNPTFANIAEKAAITAIGITPIGRLGKVVKKAGRVSKKTTKSGFGVTKHGINQKINRGVRSIDELNALKNPLKINPVKTDVHGRLSKRSIGNKAEVAINPQTGRIISVNPTSTKKLNVCYVN